ncbi:trinucleotide repeat-containing gene 6A protein isoform X3 [Amblyraja radiata]|uniref:trinucleotide repeat-containing gene 6A protein isoform X3 n=1 Tax=Amblyraja radiata TaxID=386614 RepID=UPI0014038753|nr:trinucleotide repeat-containing gene 6A protein isoform X3 [Amblyraja radiata]
MRGLEVNATKETQEKQNRDRVQEKEGQLMEERKKRKDDKKKKEAALKKAIEQKSKVPAPSKTSQSQLQPANSNSGTSINTSNNSNAKRDPANTQQQALSRYPPREVPPRFRHQEQKQLLKRGQQLPSTAGTTTSVITSQTGSSAVTVQAVTNGQLQYSSKPLTDLNHSGLGSHYENSHWGPVSINSDSTTNWDKVIVDGSDKEAWPSITGSDPELASECMDIESASSSGSEKNLRTMASGSTVSDGDGNRTGSGNGSSSQFVVGNVSNNVGNGSINGPWGGSRGSISSTCQGSAENVDGKPENSHGQLNAWGSIVSTSNGSLKQNGLNPNTNLGAWPLLENDGNTVQGPVPGSNSGSNVQRSTVGQMLNNQSVNIGLSAPSSWGGLQENSDAEVNGTRKVSFSGQPQNLNTEMNGPNNTTNPLTSSLPNSTSSMQTNELPKHTGPGAWGAPLGMSTVNPSQLQASSVTNGTSVSQLGNGGISEGMNSGSYGTTWGTPGTNYSGEKCPGPSCNLGQASGDTVNATLAQSATNGSGSTAYKNNGGSNRGGVTWESGVVNSHNVTWGAGNSLGSGGTRKVWGNPAPNANTGTKISNGEWNKLPNNQHSSNGLNGSSNRKGTNGWKSLDDALCGQDQNSASQPSEQNNLWVKTSTSCTADSEGSTESTGSRHDRMSVGSSDGNNRRGEKRKPDQPVMAQNIVNRSDLDPRVLSNTGWGQTPIKQNTAWDIEPSAKSERKTDNGTEAWGCSVSQASNSGGWGDGPRPNSNDTSSVSGWGDPKPATVSCNTGWGDTKGSSSQGGWENNSAATGTVKSNQTWGGNKEEKLAAWNDAQKVKQGWSDGQKSSQGWGQSAPDGWGENSRSGQWGELQKTGAGSWDNDSERSAPGWNEPGRPGAGRGTWTSSNNPDSNNTTGWGEPAKAAQSQGWGELANAAQSPQGWGETSKAPQSSHGWGETSKPAQPPQGWCEPAKPAPAPQGWGDPSKSAQSPQDWREPTKSSNSADWHKPQDGNSPWANKPPSQGWHNGPMPAPSKEEEPTGWEEPSPESIRRKMEIDDGTAAWGDPSKYNYKSVNMWNKNMQSNSNGSEQPAQILSSPTTPQPPPQHQQQLPQQMPPPSAIQSKESNGSGWGESCTVQTKPDSSWGGPPALTVTVDNGTAAWGQPMDTGANWREPVNDSPGTSGWGNTPAAPPPPNRPGPKPMQDGWGDEETLVSGPRHSSWEEEEGDSVMWNSNISQDSNSSSNWTSKKMAPKGMMKGGNKQDDIWMNQLMKQFSNIGFPRESAEDTKSNKMDIPVGMLRDKRMEMDKHGMNIGEYNGIIGKGHTSRPQISKESSMERSPYYDKLSLSLSNQDGIMAEEPQTLTHISAPSMKLPPSNCALPNQALGSVGLGMQNLNSVRQNGNPNIYGGSNAAAQARGMQQPPAQPLNSSQPNLRAQVPPPLLSPQVPASLLKYATANGSLNTALLNFGPQQVAMLNQLSQLNQLNQLSQISQLQRLLQQQQKAQNQRNMSGPMRQSQEQAARVLNMQQMLQNPRQLDSSLLKQQSSSQQQPMHQSSMKPFPENLMPPSPHELQSKEPPLNSYSSYPLGGFSQPSHGQSDSMMSESAHLARVSSNCHNPKMLLPDNPNHNLLSPPLCNANSHMPGSPIHQHAGRKFTTQERSMSRGLNPNLNVPLDFGSIVNLKEPQSQQSRLKQWTAPESLPINSPLDQNSSKHGATSSGLSICSGKLLEESPFGHFDISMKSLASPPGSVGDGWPSAKSPSDKLSSNVNWPPEFRPGEPWKGYQNIDPETDPYVTPGSVMTNLSISTARDLDLLRDRNNIGSSSSMNTTLPSTSAWSLGGASSYNSSLSSTAQSTPARIGDPKSTWSTGPITNASLAHELWKVPLPPKNTTALSRPPPGLTNQKPSSSWGNSSLRMGGGWGTSDSRYNPGPSWGDISSGRITNWLVLKNLTPQIDGSTLRTLCMQHGPLITFHLNLPHGNALVCYSSKEEAAKAQKSLHMCVLGNTTILAEFASEDEINRFFAQGQSLTPSLGWQSLGSSQNRIASIDSSHPFSNRNDLNHWNGAGLSGTGSGDLHGTSLWGTPNYSTSLWGTPSSNDMRGIGSPSPINAFLPVDHLGGGESI